MSAPFTVSATDHRPGAYGDAQTLTATTREEAHALAHGLNCGLYSIAHQGTTIAYEWDGETDPREIDTYVTALGDWQPVPVAALCHPVGHPDPACPECQGVPTPTLACVCPTWDDPTRPHDWECPDAPRCGDENEGRTCDRAPGHQGPHDGPHDGNPLTSPYRTTWAPAAQERPQEGLRVARYYVGTTPTHAQPWEGIPGLQAPIPAWGVWDGQREYVGVYSFPVGMGVHGGVLDTARDLAALTGNDCVLVVWDAQDTHQGSRYAAKRQTVTADYEGPHTVEIDQRDPARLHRYAFTWAAPFERTTLRAALVSGDGGVRTLAE